MPITVTDDDNPLPDFHLLLIQARSSLNRVDMFDLDSRSNASVEIYRGLNKTYNSDALELITYVAQNYQALRKAFLEDRFS